MFIDGVSTFIGAGPSGFTAGGGYLFFTDGACGTQALRNVGPTEPLVAAGVHTLPVSPAPAQATFNDVPTDHPFFQFIEALSASGITAGCQASPPLYCPDATLTRGQMAVFLAKALGL
jgi:hypothetical protein